MKILMTSGGTREPIDGVRFLTNFSSGQTGAFLTDFFRAKDHHVTLLHGKGSQLPQSSGDETEFLGYQELDTLLTQKLSNERYDVVIHLAAVSDYSVESVEANGKSFAPDLNLKLSSDPEDLKINLKRNPKIINKLKQIAKDSSFVLIGFKLTNTRVPTERLNAIQKLAANPDIDFIVHNDLSQIDKDGKHIASIYKNLSSPIHSQKSHAPAINTRGELTGPQLHFAAQAHTKKELAESLERLILEVL